MKLECTLDNISFDFAHKRTKIEFSAYGNITPSLEEYLGKKLNVELKKANKRSLEANGYLWVLLGELQEKLGIPKEEIYRQYIYGCGVYSILPLPNDDVERFIESWKHNGLGWVCDTTKSKIEGYTNVFAYYGTSSYTKEEMAVLLSQVVDDCIDQGIPTKPKEEVESLIESWK